MSCLNSCRHVGRLTADPELRRTGTGIPVVNFTLAVSDYYPDSKGEFGTDFIDFVAWRALAEKVAGKFKKGDLLVVEGELHIRSSTDKDGRKYRNAEITAGSISKMASPSGASSNNEPTVAADEEYAQLPMNTEVPFTN